MNQAPLALQDPQDLPPHFLKTFLLAWSITKHKEFLKPWNSLRTLWPPNLLCFPSSTKMKPFPTRTQPHCGQTPASTPRWRASVEICRTSAVLTAARGTLPKPARTSRTATHRKAAVRICTSSTIYWLLDFDFSTVSVMALVFLIQVSTGLIQTKEA